MRRKHNPYFYIIISFLCVITIGSLLLWLPCATEGEGNLSFIDALFMTVSSVCVTGLSVVGNVGEELSVFGKIVLAVLIEIGGLSFLTLFTFIITIAGRTLGLSERLMMREALNQNSAKSISSLIKRIVKLAVAIQLIGFVVNLFVFIPYYDNVAEAIGISAFHAISSFNNAGLDIFGYDSSMIKFSGNVLLNINTMLLIILGGIGFIVIYDIYESRSYKKLAVHSKIVLWTTLVLIIVGFIGFKLSSFNELTVLQALFCSVTARTAGFTTVDLNILSKGSIILMIFLMFVGASPCSTGGGVKTTTLFIIIVTLFSLSKGKTPKAFHRKIATSSIIKAFSLVTVSVIYVMLIVFIICCFEPNLDLNSIIFEVVSAFGTVGLSLGITTKLTIASKIFICITMFVGRVGPMTFMSLWNSNWLKNTNEEVKYVEEKIIIG